MSVSKIGGSGPRSSSHPVSKRPMKEVSLRLNSVLLRMNRDSKIWIGAGEFAYKVFYEGEQLMFQRFDMPEGTAQGSQHLLRLGTETVIGRSSKADYTLFEDLTLSGRHCSLVVTPQGAGACVLSVRDLNSTNGTRVMWEDAEVESLSPEQQKIVDDNVRLLNSKVLAAPQRGFGTGHAGARHPKHILQVTLDSSGRFIFEGAQPPIAYSVDLVCDGAKIQECENWSDDTPSDVLRIAEHTVNAYNRQLGRLRIN